MMMALRVALNNWQRWGAESLIHRANWVLLQRSQLHLCPWSCARPKMRAATVARSSVDRCISSANMPIWNYQMPGKIYLLPNAVDHLLRPKIRAEIFQSNEWVNNLDKTRANFKPVLVVRMVCTMYCTENCQLPSQSCLFLTTIHQIEYHIDQDFLFEKYWHVKHSKHFNVIWIDSHSPDGSIRSGAMYAKIKEISLTEINFKPHHRRYVTYVYSPHQWFLLLNRLNNQKCQNRTSSPHPFDWSGCLMASHLDESLLD